MRPLIGIPCQADYREGSGRPIYCNNRSYVQAIEHAGGVPILIPMVNDVGTLHPLLGRLDGMLFSGGADIQPVHYSEDPHPMLGKIDQKLDELELTMARWALQEDVPTLGVCRGMQLVNVALGGTLYQDVLTQVEGSNSLHHQAVKKLGRDVYISGRAEDGIAELLEVPEKHFVVAAQGHPEEIYMREPVWANLFIAFVDACITRNSSIFIMGSMQMAKGA
ncbi:MAG: gamma-glutamyl-gamma-aminobutyrate hydrolase family protein [Chloroflexota bacterium]|nr:MAG: gamma-glutamyl-gamma-aminobutyrate hydrolase family protein [Chloroflexota bacterium]